LTLMERRDIRDTDEVRQQYRLWRAKALKLMAFALFLIFPNISRMVLSMFVCREVEGVSYMVCPCCSCSYLLAVLIPSPLSLCSLPSFS
jgi:hypothetical protein